MDWPFNDPDFDEHDLEHVFEYSTGESVALLRNCGNKVSIVMQAGLNICLPILGSAILGA